MNPFKRHQGNPEPDITINSHQALWDAVTLLRIGQARVEERTRFNWLLGVGALTGQVATLSLVVTILIKVIL